MVEEGGGGLKTVLNMQRVASYSCHCFILSVMKLASLVRFSFNESAHDLMGRFLIAGSCLIGENYCRNEGTKLLSRRLCIDCCTVEG